MSMRLDYMWEYLTQRITELSARLDVIEAKESALSFDAVTELTLAEAEALGTDSISVRWISDGLREGGGVGVLAYFDKAAGNWKRVSDNGVVTT